jgi:hypothetical protein
VLEQYTEQVAGALVYRRGEVELAVAWRELLWLMVCFWPAELALQPDGCFML